MKGIIFDFGHTLMEFHGEWPPVEEEGAARLTRFLSDKGVTPPAEFASYFVKKRHDEGEKSDVTCVEYTAREALLESLRHFGISLNGNAAGLVENALEVYFSPEEDGWYAYPDAHEALDKLRAAGYRIGMISNATDHPFILRCAEKLGFTPYLDPILSSAAFHSRKPHPQIFWSVANGWKMKYDQVIMVGDQLYYDVFGAHQSGMRAVWIERNAEKAYTYVPEHLKSHPQLVPDRTITALSELPEAVKAIR